MKKTIIYAVVLVVVSLIVGVVIGGALERRCHYVKRMGLLGDLQEKRLDLKKPMAIYAHKKMLGHLAKELKLTEEQKEKIKGILDASREQIATVGGESFERVAAIRDETTAKIKAALTPEQQEKFENIITSFKQRKKAKRGLCPRLPLPE
jgi:Spy/CpxP family protein refolding chaperone